MSRTGKATGGSIMEMDEEFKANVKKLSTWIRLIYMIFFVVFFKVKIQLIEISILSLLLTLLSLLLLLLSRRLSILLDYIL